MVVPRTLSLWCTDVGSVRRTSRSDSRSPRRHGRTRDETATTHGRASDPKGRLRARIQLSRGHLVTNFAGAGAQLQQNQLVYRVIETGMTETGLSTIAGDDVVPVHTVPGGWGLGRLWEATVYHRALTWCCQGTTR
jgi:hypothetical protein